MTVTPPAHPERRRLTGSEIEAERGATCRLLAGYDERIGFVGLDDAGKRGAGSPRMYVLLGIRRLGVFHTLEDRREGLTVGRKKPIRTGLRVALTMSAIVTEL